MAEPELLPAAHHETRDLSFRAFAIGIGGMLGTLVLLALFALWLFPRATADRTIRLPFPASPAPALQSSPRADMQRFLHAELQRLNSAGWIDRANGVVHIPIAEAMRKVAQEGIAGWPTAAMPDTPDAAGEARESAAAGASGKRP
ncbi:MAG: hypothetical protein JO209_06500 [Acidisphaera sp.]|nr:hypothetical protein [Acidisphaera sp.]